MTVDIKIAAGQRLMAGLPGTELDPGFVSLVRECKVGNVILFRRNVKSAAQLERLCTSLRRLIVAETGFEPFIAIDQEGGVVSRFSPDMAITPGAMALAAAGGDAPYRAARITAQQLRAAGVNFDLAPVLDVNSNPLNPVIGVRSFGDVPEEAAERALGFMRGLLDGGIMACGKHFPGHGDTDTDSHIGLPKVDKSREELEKCELLPFRRAIEAGIPAIMTSHVLFPAIEPEKLPATMSRRILTGLLREEMGFCGVIISDCMEMDAVAKYYGTVHAATTALDAGADIVCISHTAASRERPQRSSGRAMPRPRASTPLSSRGRGSGSPPPSAALPACPGRRRTYSSSASPRASCWSGASYFSTAPYPRWANARFSPAAPGYAQTSPPAR